MALAHRTLKTAAQAARGATTAGRRAPVILATARSTTGRWTRLPLAATPSAVAADLAGPVLSKAASLKLCWDASTAESVADTLCVVSYNSYEEEDCPDGMYTVAPWLERNPSAMNTLCMLSYEENE